MKTSKEISKVLLPLIEREPSKNFKVKATKFNTNWTKLSMYLMINNISVDEICSLIHLELKGRNRVDILGRLTSRLTSELRTETTQLVQQMHEEHANARKRSRASSSSKSKGPEGEVHQADPATDGDTR